MRARCGARIAAKTAKGRRYRVCPAFTALPGLVSGNAKEADLLVDALEGAWPERDEADA